MTEAVKDQPREELAGAEPTREVPIFTPRFDIVETDNELTLYGDLPGVKQEQIDIQYENEQLVIHATVPDRAKAIEFLRQEYRVGDYHRVFTIGESIDAEQINAEVHNGVLTIHLPKTEAVKPRRIAVKSV